MEESQSESPIKEHSHLRRLEPEYYQADAVVHWSMTIDQRQTGFLNERFHRDFRESLIHTCYLYRLLVPCYVWMPDHLHLIAMGYRDESDQLKAMKFFRARINQLLLLEGSVFRLQKQGFDNVLRAEGRKKNTFETLVNYVFQNPIRAGLVQSQDSDSYPYQGCVIPGCPELAPYQDDFWERFWRVYPLMKEGAFAR